MTEPDEVPPFPPPKAREPVQASHDPITNDDILAAGVERAQRDRDLAITRDKLDSERRHLRDLQRGTYTQDTPGNIWDSEQRINALERQRDDQHFLDRHGCSPKVLAALAVLVGAILVIFNVAGDDDPKCKTAGEVAGVAADCVDPTTALTAAPQESVPTNGAAPPNVADLAPGVQLYQGTSGGPIGCIACDGQSRFLSLERPGVGVGNLSSTEFESMWTLDGKVLEFGAQITAANKGRYGVNLWIDGQTYGPGVALEIGESSAVYTWSPERDGTIGAGHLMAIIVGEAGTVDEDGVPTAQGDYVLTWWFTFQPDA